MTRTGAKALLGVGAALAGLGAYIVWWATARGYFKPDDAYSGLAIGGVGSILLAVGLAKLGRAVVGIAVAVLAASLGGVVVVRAWLGYLDERELERREMLASFRPVCETGTGIARALPRNDVNPVRTTVVFARPDEHAGYELWEVEPRWTPASVALTQQVACFAPSRRVVERCAAGGERVRRVVTGTIREALTGHVVAEQTFAGPEPAPCPPSSHDGRELAGAPPSRDELIRFVRRHAELAERPSP